VWDIGLKSEMRLEKIFWKIYLPYLLTTVIALLIGVLLVANIQKKIHLDQIKRELTEKIEILRPTISLQIKLEKFQEIQDEFKVLGETQSTRTTLILSDGTVVGDTHFNFKNMENYKSRLEVHLALQGQANEVIRFSTLVNKECLFVAVPLQIDDRFLGVIRGSIETGKISIDLSSIYLKWVVPLLFILFVSSIVMLPITGKISNPIERLEKHAISLATGDFSKKLNEKRGDPKEIKLLIKAINLMQEEINKKVSTLIYQEGHRKAFVSNVSHELKTPLTAIKGYIETLQENDLTDRKIIRQFLEIIEKNSKRLEVIIDDLLTISKLEKDQEQATLEKSKQSLKSIVSKSKVVCDDKAFKSGVKINVKNEQDIIINVNGSLLEQAIVNLIDNAIKYAATGKIIELSYTVYDHEVKISVMDYGPGIADEHHDRIFERFYTVSKDRSRSLGGSGLGLSIVKHIALLHGGRVTLSSFPGRGSTFVIHLPIV